MVGRTQSGTRLVGAGRRESTGARPTAVVSGTQVTSGANSGRLPSIGQGSARGSVSNAGGIPPAVVPARHRTVKPISRGGLGSRGRGGRGSAGDAQLWGAVALQQHLATAMQFDPRSGPQSTSSFIAQLSQQRDGGSRGTRGGRSTRAGGAVAGQPSHSGTGVTGSQQHEGGTESGGGQQSVGPTAHAMQRYDKQGNPILSLAQKMGLVDGPPPPPTVNQWDDAVHEATRRNLVKYPCAICLESFSSDRPMVILDCSHVFHKTCLMQFEKLVAKSCGDGVRSCPMCRRRNYYKRPFTEGASQVEYFAICRIQAVYRGILARKQYLKLRLAANPGFRSSYYYGKLQRMSDAHLSLATQREVAVNDFLENLDLERNQFLADNLTDEEWREVRQKIVDRGGGEELECAICMDGLEKPAAFSSSGAGGGRGAGSSGKSSKSCVLLSCSHCFHETCLTSLENFNAGGTIRAGRNTSSEAKQQVHHKCPTCRAVYAKQPLWV